MRKDKFLIGIIVTLVMFGIIMVYSSSIAFAEEKFNNPYFFLIRHLIWVLLGSFAFIITYKFPYQKWRKFAKPLLFFSLFLILLTLTPLGWESGGAKRWLKVGRFTFQPSELAKFTILIWLADLLERRKSEVSNFFEGLTPPLLIIGGFLLLLLFQPDLGTGLLIVGVSFFLFFVGGASLKHLFGLFLLSLPTLYALIFTKEYRKNRIIAFLDPWKNPKTSGYHLIQSLIAVGSGGIFGRGLGEGRQKLLYLPSAYNDFIFAVIGEELGFIGTSIVVLLFFCILITGLLIAKRTSDLYASYLTLGITLMITGQAFINMGVSVGILPTKGIPLPLVSAGGSSLVVTFALMGMLAQIGKQER